MTGPGFDLHEYFCQEPQTLINALVQGHVSGSAIRENENQAWPTYLKRAYGLLLQYFQHCVLLSRLMQPFAVELRYIVPKHMCKVIYTKPLSL